MMDLSVVIATHQDPLGLYLTLFSVLQQLHQSKLQSEVIIAADGGTEYKYEKLPDVRCLRIRTGSPQGTRDAGIREARAKSVLCIESHVIVSDIVHLMEMHEILGGAMTFPARIAEGPELFNVFGTTTDFDGNLWFKDVLYSPPDIEPYRVPQFGHSCFMIDKKQYEEVGGYTNLLTGWGFEEPLLCLKFWMMGKECWQVPEIWHAHYLDNRGAGKAMASEAFKNNARIVKYLLTGEILSGLQVTAEMRAERRKICEGPFQGDMNKLRDYFKAEGIIN